MSVDRLISILASITLMEMMATIGLGVTLGEVAGVAKDWRLVGRAALANYIVVPAVAVGLLLLFRANPMVSVGILIVAVCPGAPYGPPFTTIAKGNTILSIGLMVILAGSSAFIAPLLLQNLLPIVAGDLPLRVDALKIVGALALSQFLPLCLGLFVRRRYPAFADRLKKPFAKLSTLLNLALLSAVLAVQFRTLMEIRLVAYLGMLALVSVAFFAGWISGGSKSEDRKSLAITTSVRNVGVGLVIASGSFPGTPALMAATAYGLFQTIVLALVAVGCGRLSQNANTAPTLSTSQFAKVRH